MNWQNATDTVVTTTEGKGIILALIETLGKKYNYVKYDIIVFENDVAIAIQDGGISTSALGKAALVSKQFDGSIYHVLIIVKKKSRLWKMFAHPYFFQYPIV